MRLTIFGIALVLALALTTGTASATLVDDYTVGSLVIDLAGGGASSDGGVGPVGPFTTRTLSAISDGPNPLMITVDGGYLTSIPFPVTVGTGNVVYAGGGPIDFSLATAFTIGFAGANDPGGDIYIAIADTDSVSPFISFTGGATLGTTGTTLSVSTGHASFAGIDFYNVQAIQLMIDTGPVTGNTMAFSTFRTTDIPEPATMLLMGVGLVALGVIGRRRRLKS